MNTAVTGPPETAGHTAQVKRWASQAGHKLDIAYLKCGPDHETKWFAGPFSEYMLQFQNRPSH